MLFFSMGLRSGYWQIPVDERDRVKTSFVTPDCLNELKVMPFDLRNAPATFERMMDTFLRGLGGLLPMLFGWRGSFFVQF